MKNFRIIAALLALLALAHGAHASQGYADLPTSGTLSGLQAVQSLNMNTDALLSLSASTTAPSYAVGGMLWATTSTVNYYDGSSWLPLGTTTSHEWGAVSNGVPLTVPSSTGSSNAYVVTYATVPTAYVSGQHYPFIANFANTGSATVNVNSLGTKTLKKNATTNLASADITSGQWVDTVYDGTNMQTSGIGTGGSGSVSSITGDGAFITNSASAGSVTLVLGNAAADTIWANNTSGSTTPAYTSAPVILSLGLTGTGTVSGSFTGMHEATANQLALTASGSDGLVLTNTGITIGSPTGGNKGAGTINATNLYVNGSAVGTSGATVTSVSLADTSTNAIYAITGSPVTTSGTLNFALKTTTSNLIFAGPASGSAAYPTFRLLVNADMPAPTLSALGGIEAIATTSHQWIANITTGGIPQQSQPACGDLSNSGTSCTVNTGTSGATLGLLNGGLTFSGADTFSNTVSLGSTTSVLGVLNATDGIAVSGGAVTDAPSALAISTTTFTPVSIASNTYRVVLTSACPCLIANPSGSAVDGARFVLEIWQPAASATKTVTWGTNYDFGTAGSPTLSTTTGAGDVVGFSYSAQNSKYLYLGVQQGM